MPISTNGVGNVIWDVANTAKWLNAYKSISFASYPNTKFDF